MPQAQESALARRPVLQDQAIRQGRAQPLDDLAEPGLVVAGRDIERAGLSGFEREELFAHLLVEFENKGVVPKGLDLSKHAELILHGNEQEKAEKEAEKDPVFRPFRKAPDLLS